MYNYMYGWCGTSGGHIYRYEPVIDDIINKNNNIPKTFFISQNYPNPFNPSTTIDFSIPKSSNVSLKIYDVLGNEVMNVMNEFKPAGNYSVNVNAMNLTSGIYFYKFVAGQFTNTKKMIITK